MTLFAVVPVVARWRLIQVRSAMRERELPASCASPAPTGPSADAPLGSHRQAKFPGGLFLRAIQRDESIDPRVGCILLGEEGGARLSKETDGAELLSSVVLMLETRRNLIRLAREGALKPNMYKTCLERVDQDTSLFVLRDVTLDLCQSYPLPAVTTPRSLVLAHARPLRAWGLVRSRRPTAVAMAARGA